jgi:hypothetical protein
MRILADPGGIVLSMDCTEISAWTTLVLVCRPRHRTHDGHGFACLR